MSTRDIVVIGASAGGILALRELVALLPASYAGTLFVVVHMPADYRSILPEILNWHGTLPASHAVDGASVVKGHIYVAPPGSHLLLQPGVMRLSYGPKENYSRPAADPLFRSAAEVYGERVVGVVLSGMLYDGTAGLITIKRAGGMAIVQDPDEAAFASMPRSAISRDHPDCVLPLSAIAATLVRLAQETSLEQTEGQTYARSD